MVFLSSLDDWDMRGVLALLPSLSYTFGSFQQGTLVTPSWVVSCILPVILPNADIVAMSSDFATFTWFSPNQSNLAVLLLPFFPLCFV